ncbi:MAG: type II secretion system F family protein, partial [Nitrospirales bacterium]
MTAGTKEDVIAQLRRRNITATIVTEKQKKTSKFSFGGGVKDKDIVIFTRQFATMIDAGLPLVQALDILSTQVESKTLSNTLAQVKVDVESGATYADALKKHPRVFNELYVNMVAAGEAGGILDVILRRLSAYMEKAAKLKAQVKGAMTYPIVTLFIAVGVVAVILVFVIPVVEEMFASFGSALPAPTQIVVAMSRFVQTKILYIIVT